MSTRKPSKPRVEAQSGLDILRAWGSGASPEPPTQSANAQDEEPPCHRFAFRAPILKRRALAGIDPATLPPV